MPDVVPVLLPLGVVLVAVLVAATVILGPLKGRLPTSWGPWAVLGVLGAVFMVLVRALPVRSRRAEERAVKEVREELHELGAQSDEEMEAILRRADIRMAEAEDKRARADGEAEELRQFAKAEIDRVQSIADGDKRRAEIARLLRS